MGAVANVTMQAPELDNVAVTSVALSTVDAHAPVPTLAAEAWLAESDTAPTEAEKSEKAKTVRRNMTSSYPEVEGKGSVRTLTKKTIRAGTFALVPRGWPNQGESQ